MDPLPHIDQVDNSKSSRYGTLCERIIFPLACCVETHLCVNGKRLTGVVEILQLDRNCLVRVVFRQSHVHWLMSCREAHVHPHLGVALGLRQYTSIFHCELERDEFSSVMLMMMLMTVS